MTIKPDKMTSYLLLSSCKMPGSILSYSYVKTSRDHDRKMSVVVTFEHFAGVRGQSNSQAESNPRWASCDQHNLLLHRHAGVLKCPGWKDRTAAKYRRSKWDKQCDGDWWKLFSDHHKATRYQPPGVLSLNLMSLWFWLVLLFGGRCVGNWTLFFYVPC